MSYTKKVNYNSSIVKTAIYRAYDRKDALINCDITYREMQIDHIIPQYLFEKGKEKELENVLKDHKLPLNFNKDCLYNLCPLTKGTNGPGGKGSSIEYGLLEHLLKKAKKNKRKIEGLINQANKEIDIIQSASQIATQADDIEKELAIDIILDDMEKFNSKKDFNDNYEISNEDIRIVGTFPSVKNLFPKTTIEFRKVKIRDIKIIIEFKDLLKYFFNDAHSYKKRHFYEKGMNEKDMNEKDMNEYMIKLKGFYFHVPKHVIIDMCNMIDMLYDEYIKRMHSLLANYKLMDFKFINNNSVELIKISKRECDIIFNFIKNCDSNSEYGRILKDSTDTIIKIKNTGNKLGKLYHAIIYAQQTFNYSSYSMSNDIVLVQKIDDLNNTSKDGLWDPFYVKQWFLDELFPKVFDNYTVRSIKKNEQYLKKCFIDNHNFIKHFSQLQSFYNDLDFYFNPEISLKLIQAQKLLYKYVIDNGCKWDRNYVEGNLLMVGLEDSLDENLDCHFENGLNNKHVEAILRGFPEFLNEENDSSLSKEKKLELYFLLSDYIKIYNDHLIMDIISL